MVYITLLSDLGSQDASVAIAKGILTGHIPGCSITDINHEIIPFNLEQAAYQLSSAWKHFPGGTFHVVLFDLFSEKEPVLLLCAHQGHYFLAPDNGLLPRALGKTPEDVRLCTTFKKQSMFSDWINTVATTINALQNNASAKQEFPAYQVKQTYAQPMPASGASIIPCEVIHIDRFGNAVLNVTQEQFAAVSAGRQFRLQFMQVEEINELSTDYADVRRGYKLCRFNSNGHLEIGINHGRAAALFGLRPGSKSNDIKLIFE